MKEWTLTEDLPDENAEDSHGPVLLDLAQGIAKRV
jgi:hypothetical protein